MAELRVAPIVTRELKRAIDWYAQRSPEAANHFADAIKSAMASIKRSPEQFAKCGKRYRRVLLQRFPYYVAYEIKGEFVIIVGVRHTSRRNKRFE